MLSSWSLTSTIKRSKFGGEHLKWNDIVIKPIKILKSKSLLKKMFARTSACGREPNSTLGKQTEFFHHRRLDKVIKQWLLRPNPSPNTAGRCQERAMSLNGLDDDDFFDDNEGLWGLYNKLCSAGLRSVQLTRTNRQKWGENMSLKKRGGNKAFFLPPLLFLTPEVQSP